MSDQTISAEQIAAAVLGEEDGQPETELETSQEDAPEGQEAAEQQVESEQDEADTPQGEEAEAEADTAGQANTAPADDSVVKWTTASGETFEAPIGELKAGYMRQTDYTQKTQALADERKQVEQATQQRVQEIERYSSDFGELSAIRQRVGQYEQWLAQAAQSGTDPNTIAQAQSEYLMLRQQFQDKQQGLVQKRAQFMHESEQRRSQELQQANTQALEHLGKVIPNFDAQKDVNALREYGLKSGFTGDELGQVTDKRHMEVLWKASQWDALQAKKPDALAKVRSAPPRTTKPGNSTAPPTALERANKQLKARPDARSFAAALVATDSI